MDSFLKTRTPGNFCKLLPQRLLSDDGKTVNASLVNCLVVYLGVSALQNKHTGQQLNSPEMEVIMSLMTFDPAGRYTCLNSIANQLRYPNSHTHYFGCVLLYLFQETSSDGVREQITRVLLERLIVHRPHPWGLLICFIELIKNPRYKFWNYPFTRCATEIERVFESVARSCMTAPKGSGEAGAGDGGGGGGNNGVNKNAVGGNQQSQGNQIDKGKK